MTSSPELHDTPFRFIDDDRTLAEACSAWRGHDAVALDTEFVRERTFYPALGLIQVGTEDDIALVDPLAIEDFQPFVDFLEDPGVTKVLHSSSEDLEVFHHAFGALPRPLVDTQVAAAMAGIGYSLGYGALVSELCGVDLPKGETRSNWLARPLRGAQKVYAARDVDYLRPAWRELAKRLDDLGRRPWLEEDCGRLLDPNRFAVDDGAAVRKMGQGQRMGPRDLAVLHSLVLWRERTARERDLARNFVLHKNALREIAQRKPRNLAALRRIPGIHPRGVDRHGRTILDLVAKAMDLPNDQLPSRPPRPLDISPHRSTVDALRDRLSQRADELGLAPELLANRRTIESLVRRHLGGEAPVLPAALRGWRQGVVGETLVEALGDLLPPPR
ncbi:MAG: ribonuclease D [Acidobacteriota bacterium]